MENLGAHAQAFAEAPGANGHDHELLEIDRGVGVRAAVHDVHHRHRQHLGVGPAEILVERLADGGGRGARGCEGDAEDGVGAELGFRGGSVQRDHRAVDADLVEGVPADEGRRDCRLHVGHGVEHAFAKIALFVAVAEFEGLVFAGGRAGGHGGASERAGGEADVDFDRGIATGVEDFAGGDGCDGRVHGKRKELKAIGGRRGEGKAKPAGNSADAVRGIPNPREPRYRRSAS